MFRLLLCAALATFTFSGAAYADRPGPRWISSAKVANILAKRGYRVVKIEADDGHWEGEAVRNGRKYDFHVDPHTGAITKIERDRD